MSNGIPLNDKETKFLVNLIRTGRKTKRECIDALKGSFGRSINTRNLSDFARRHNLFFKEVQPDAWTEREEAIIKGLWLVGASQERRVLELPSRGPRAMQRKLLDFNLKGVLKNMKNKIKSDVKNKVSTKQIAEKHGVAEKFVKEYVDGENASSVEFKNLKRWETEDIEKLFDILQASQEQQRKIDSEQTVADVAIRTKSKYIAITVFSDLHLENVNTDLGQVRGDFNIVRNNPDFYAGFNGDLIDNFAAGPHADGVIEAVVAPAKARMMAGKLFETIKGKLLWVVLGCHDAWDKNHADYDLPQHIARKLGVPYLGHGGDINLKVNGIDYFIHSRHKFSGSSGVLNGTNCCKKVLTQIDPKFDIVSISHNHFSEIRLEHYLGKQRCYLRTGSYKREDRYSKMLGFRTNEFNIQIPVVLLNTETKEMKVVSGIQNAAEMLKALNSVQKKKKPAVTKKKTITK